MSRLQKKKPAVEKKKKKEAKKSVTADENISSVRQTAVSSLPKSKPEVQAVASKDKKDNFVGNATEFLREVKVELKKVTWPTRKQTTGTTIVVIIFVIILAVFLGIFDYSLSRLVQVVLT
jgi:preprotein translocase subunit SecE